MWCPFDTEDSHFVKEIGKLGCKVLPSHISENKSFSDYQPEEDYSHIISNPPYSLKNEVFERLFRLGKPFAMQVGFVGIFESQRKFNLFSNKHPNRNRLNYFLRWENENG